MFNLRRAMAGRGARVLADGVLGVIAVSGLAMAVTLASCESGGSGWAKRSKDAPVAASRGKGEGPAPGGGGGRELPPVHIAAEPELRVRVLTGVETVTLASPGGLLIAPGDPKALAAPAPAKGERVGGSVTVTCRGGQWTIAEAGKAARTVPSQGQALLVSGEGGRMVGVGGAGGPQYPGTLRLTARSDVRDGAFDVVEFVGVEQYLPGVVAKEMMTGWPLEAYRAQAVAARTYALHERERSLAAGQAFDLESSDRDQVYGGATSNGVAREAVESTRGVVLMDGDRLLRTYFSSTCGGRTASARDTWPTGPGFEYNLAGPIQAHHRESACTGSPLYRWQVERPRGELVQRLRAFGERQGLMVKRIKDLKAIEVMAYNGDGRPSRYKLIEPGGAWYQLSAEELRLGCNAGVNGGKGVAAAPAPGVTVVADSGGTAPGAPTLGVEAGPSGAVIGPPATVTLPDVTRQTRVHSSDFEAQVVGERVVFSGRGFGHGVGLCQYCAKAFAERGETWRVMMERFYPGARIVDLY